MQRIEIDDGGGDTRVQANGINIGSRQKPSISKKSTNIPTQVNVPSGKSTSQDQCLPHTPAPLLGSPSEFCHQALLRGYIRRNTRRSQTEPTLQPASQSNANATSQVIPDDDACATCSDIKPSVTPLLAEWQKQCRRQNRNSTLYRIATPLEMSRIPEHLRNLKTIQVPEPENFVDVSIPVEKPPAYYPPKPGVKKVRKPQAYWRWERADKTKQLELPAVCRLVDEARQPDYTQVTEHAPSVGLAMEVDVLSDPDTDDEPDFDFEFVQDPSVLKPMPDPLDGSTADWCGPKTKYYTKPENAAHSEMYRVCRGPRLIIRTKTYSVLLEENTDDSKPKLYMESFDDFATTTKCIDMRKITLVNTGTSALRFQWIRSRPGVYLQKFLANPAKLLQLGKTFRTIRPAQIAANQQRGAECPLLTRGSGPRKLAVHLNASRKVNPALTRTIKLLQSTVSADGAFQNLLLLLSLRVPRLRRELIRRTHRQLKSRLLPQRLQDLYVQLRKQRRVKHYMPKSVEVSGSEPACTCESSDSSSSASSESDIFDNLLLRRGKRRTECVCPPRPSSPLPASLASAEWGPEDLVKLPSPTQFVDDMALCRYRPRIECVCEGICICEPPAEDQGYCVCGPCCICSPQKSWQALATWNDTGEDADTCRCMQPCTCDRPVEIYPATPPPSERAESLTDIVCPSQDPCDSDLICRDPSRCSILGEIECSYLEPCPPEEPPLLDCTCDPQCTCVTPPESCSEGHLSGTCACLPCLCDPPPEDVCTCGPDCICRTPVASDQCLVVLEPGPTPVMTPVTPEDCPCPACQCGDFEACHSLWATTLPFGAGAAGGGDACLEPIDNAGEAELDRVAADANIRPISSYIDIDRFYERSHVSHPYPGEDGGEDVDIQKIRRNQEIRFLKSSTSEFLFCESPRILLPGQKVDFEIVFRPREPGLFFETIHLLTHPRFTSGAYAVRMRGLCVNPEDPPESCVFNSPTEHEPEVCMKSAKVTEVVYNSMYQRQGTQALSAIVDKIINSESPPKSTFPFGRLTTEAMFKTHNPHLHYYPETSEKALYLAKTLVQLLVSKRSIVNNPAICQRNITKLYHSLLQHPSTQHYFKHNFLSDEVEALLAEFAECTAILTTPPIFNLSSANDRCQTATEVGVHAMIDEVFATFASIEDTLRNPFSTYVWRKVIRGKLEKVRDAEIEHVKQQAREKRELRARKGKADIATQTQTQTKTNSKEDSGSSSLTEVISISSDEESKLNEIMPQLTNIDVESQLQQMNRESIYETRFSAAQEIISQSIERMLSFIDTSDNLLDYEKTVGFEFDQSYLGG